MGASFKNRGSVKSVVVTPPGTFRLRGTVSEAGSNERVPDVSLEVRTATGDVLQTTTGRDGTFLMYGVPPDAALKVTHSKYIQHTETLTLAEHGTLNVQLTLANPAVQVAGTYTLTVGSSECPGAGQGVLPLAEDLRRRTYTAVVVQKGRNLEVTLSGTAFGTKSSGEANRFFGEVDGSRVRFTLFGADNFYYYYYYSSSADVAERLGDGTYLIPSGAADLTISGQDLQGTLTGWMSKRATPARGQLLARCVGTFPFVLSR